MPTPERVVSDRYELRDRIGSGGMGAVWHAFDTRLRRDVAVKEIQLPQGLSEEEQESARTRMVREAQAAARVVHPSVVTVHDVIEEDGRPFIVMELLGGTSLQHILDTVGPLPAARVERLARSMLEALGAAHRADVLHRDIKPANIMLTDEDRAVLTDFGIAALLDTGTALTATGTFIGTAEYMAPERFEEEPASRASDLWSLGVTLFAAIGGDSPFRRKTLTGTLTAVLTQPVPECPAPGPLGALVNGLLERDPVARMTLDQALTLLDDAASGPTATAEPPPVPDPPVPDPPVQDTHDASVSAESVTEVVDVPAPTRRYTSVHPAPAPSVPPATPRPPSRRRALGIWTAVGLGLAGVGSVIAVATRPERVEYETFTNDHFTLRYPVGWDTWDQTEEEEDGWNVPVLSSQRFIHPSGDYQMSATAYDASSLDVTSYRELEVLEEQQSERDDVSNWSTLELESDASVPNGWDVAYLEATMRNTTWRLEQRHTAWKNIIVDEETGYQLWLGVPLGGRFPYRLIRREAFDSFRPVMS